MTDTSRTNAPKDATLLPDGLTGTEDWFLTHQAMRQLVEAGEAQPLSKVIVDFVRYRGTWWISYSDGWVANDHAGLNTRLDRIHQRAATDRR